MKLLPYQKGKKTTNEQSKTNERSNKQYQLSTFQHQIREIFFQNQKKKTSKAPWHLRVRVWQVVNEVGEIIRRFQTPIETKTGDFSHLLKLWWQSYLVFVVVGVAGRVIQDLLSISFLLTLVVLLWILCFNTGVNLIQPWCSQFNEKNKKWNETTASRSCSRAGIIWCIKKIKLKKRDSLTSSTW